MIDFRVKKAILGTAVVYSMALLSNPGAGFSPLAYLNPAAPSSLYAQDKASDAPAGRKSRRAEKAGKKGTGDAEKEMKKEDLFLEESEKNIDYLPEIFRCPECGYEQDEEGFCPDHNLVALVKVVSAGRDPLAPVEYDGNEDIVVDIPLKNLQFKIDGEADSASSSTVLKQEK